MATGTGIVILDFGTVPGSNIASTAVSEAGISATSKVEIFLMGTDSTASHNAYEHQMLPMGGTSLSVTSITAGVGFTAQCMSILKLTGTFQARYVWAD